MKLISFLSVRYEKKLILFLHGVQGKKSSKLMLQKYAKSTQFSTPGRGLALEPKKDNKHCNHESDQINFTNLATIFFSQKSEIKITGTCIRRNMQSESAHFRQTCKDR
jgi:hypothetical protein